MKIPEETQDKIREHRNLTDMRDEVIKLWWGEKRALKYVRLSNNLLEEIKNLVYRLYPQLYLARVWHWWYMKDGTIEVFIGDAKDTVHGDE